MSLVNKQLQYNWQPYNENIKAPFNETWSIIRK